MHFIEFIYIYAIFNTLMPYRYDFHFNSPYKETAYFMCAKSESLNGIYEFISYLWGIQGNAAAYGFTLWGFFDLQVILLSITRNLLAD